MVDGNIFIKVVVGISCIIFVWFFIKFIEKLFNWFGYKC